MTKRLTVLVVDDLPTNRKLLRVQLEAEGHTVVEASNGLEALGVLQQQPFDLIVSDILMPVMDGYRLCGEVRLDPRLRDLPFIVCTATYTSPADEDLCFQLGADAYLRKPIGAKDLLAAIERVLASERRTPSLPLDRHDVLKEYSERLVMKLEQKNTELAEASDTLRLQATALDSAADAILITDRHGRVTWVNRAFCASTGIVLAEAVGCSPLTLDVPAPDGIFTSSYWTRHPADVWRGELVTHGRTNELTVTPVRANGGGITHFIGVLRDITERRLAQDELRESERRFREMLDNLQLIAIMRDRDGRITYCNDHLLRLTGWRRADVLCLDWFDLFIAPEQRAELRQVFVRHLGDAPPASHHESEILTRSGQRRLIRWNNTVLRATSGEVLGSASIGEDVTERKNLERQMLRAQRLESLGTLAGGIAHDLNNLLMPVLVGASLLKRLGLPPNALNAVDNIERSVTRGRELVKQVLLFARGAETSREPVDLAGVVDEVESIARSTFPKDITFDVAIPSGLGRVTGDVTQLTQVVLNLCVNARDAMPHGGHIRIAARTEEVPDRFAQAYGSAGGAYLVLEVADTGEGMPEEIVDLIFDPFFTTKPPGLGTGLGLSTVQGIVSSHGGFIAVSSRPGEGSTFRIYLPMLAQESGARAATEEDGPPPRGNGELVMIVDDDASALSIMRQTLETFGYRVVTAEDGAQAIDIYAPRHDEVALVVTDLAMPVIDGYALVAALTKIKPDVRIIAATGNTTAAYLTNLAQSGVTNVLKKPFTADQLLRSVAEALGK